MPLSDKATCPYCEAEASLKGFDTYRCPKCRNIFMPEERKEQFHNWNDYVMNASADIYSTSISDMLFYPIRYLTDALSGIGKSELVVLGSDTGLGKTQLCNDTAFCNAEREKRVKIFSLEGDKYDMANRERYKRIAKMYYADDRHDLDMSYKNFVLNMLGDSIEDYVLAVDKELRNKYSTLKVYTRYKPLDVDILTEQLDLVKDDTDLVIIDHLHYFDFGEQEHSEITKIMKKIQLLKSTYRIPVIIASHLRKKGKDRIFPDNNDFHGSSNIAKQADTCIILAPVNFDDENNEFASDIYPTGIRITKGRQGISQRLVGVVDFDLRTKEYSKDYTMAVVGLGGVKKLECNQYPRWARKTVKWSNSFEEKTF